MTEAELKVIITAEIDKLKQELDKGKKETERFGKKAKSSLEPFGKACKAVGKRVKRAM